MSETRHRTDHAERLERARERLRDLEREIDDHGEETVETAATAYRRATDLLENYVDRATGTGRETFKAYVQLEGQFSTLVEGLPDDLPRRGAFESALEAVDKRRLSESDFERAEDALEPAAEFAALLEDRESAREEVRAARTAAQKRLRDLEDEIADHERLLELASVDLDVPTERLAEPIRAYDEAVRESFAAYRQEAPARELFALLERTRWYPFIPFERPPAELRDYVAENPAGEYAITELLEYADYSRSKLSHYVDDAAELKRRVATRQTYLEGIDADPLTIGWPPEPAATLRYRLRELESTVARFDESLLPRLRKVSERTYDPEFEELRTAAVATDQMDAAEREKVADGRVEDELAALRRERDRLEDALAAE